eukprot:scaffold305676_cov37-Tisochrysis_lutea.AAC.1
MASMSTSSAAFRLQKSVKRRLTHQLTEPHHMVMLYSPKGIAQRCSGSITQTRCSRTWSVSLLMSVLGVHCFGITKVSSSGWESSAVSTRCSSTRSCEAEAEAALSISAISWSRPELLWRSAVLRCSIRNEVRRIEPTVD